jgi:hypothetical protein
VELRFIDEFEHGFGWTPEGDRLGRASHAVRIGSAVWLTDILDGPGIDERIRELGEPRGVIQLLDRHERDCSAIARRLGVPLHVTPFDGVPDAPFEVIPVVRSRFWKEVRLKPPRKAFACLEPLHVLCGHGQGGHGEGVPEAVRQALATPRRRLPQALLNGLREARRPP